MEPDVLSDILRMVRLKATAFFDVRAHAPWAAEAPAATVIAQAVMPDSEHVVEYHVITHGRCWLTIAGVPPVELTAGDVMMLPHGDAHVLSSHPGMRGVMDDAGYRPPAGTRLPLAVNFNERPHQAPTTQLVCGFFGCDRRPFNPLLESLPRLLVARSDDSRRGRTLQSLVEMVAAEAASLGSGSACVLTKLSELMLIELVRRHLEDTSPASTGWFAGMRDPQLGRALARIHADPATPWTIAQLARVAGMSRSLFAQRFLETAGLAPMQYLTRWRMQVASNLLTEGSSSLAEVGAAVGYRSETAFLRAFKRTMGCSPGAWRRGERHAEALVA